MAKQTTEMVPAMDASFMVRKSTSDAKVKMSTEGYSCEVQHTLSEGEEIEGTFIGAGRAVDFVNEKTGVVNTVGVWRIRSDDGNLIVNLLGSSQLDSRMGSLKEGVRVLIQHKGKVRTNKNMQANNYLILTKSA
jgi:hypothetical protein